MNRSKVNKTDKANKLRKIGLIVLLIMFCLLVLIEIKEAVLDSKWNGKGSFNVVIEKENQIQYVKIDPKLNEIVVFGISENTMAYLAYGYGEYRADKIKDLAEIDNISYGDLLQKSMNLFLGSLTDAYIVDIKKAGIGLNETLLRSIFFKNKTNLTRWDLVRMLAFIQKLRSEDIEYVDLGMTRALSLVNLADGSEVYIASEFFDDYVLKNIARPEFLEQDITWEIFNGTAHDGLAARMKKVLANSGLDVIGIRQEKADYQKSFISSREGNNVVSQIANYYNLEIRETDQISDRADVVFVLGEDFWQENFQLER
jgi:LytR cell envelope-related transcriptional attenuator